MRSDDRGRLFLPDVPFVSDDAAVAHYVTHSPAELAFALLRHKAVIQHALVVVDEPGGIRTERHMDEIIAEVDDTASRSPGRTIRVGDLPRASTVESVNTIEGSTPARPWRPEDGPQPEVWTWPYGDRPALAVWSAGAWRYAPVFPVKSMCSGSVAHQGRVAAPEGSV